MQETGTRVWQSFHSLVPLWAGLLPYYVNARHAGISIPLLFVQPKHKNQMQTRELITFLPFHLQPFFTIIYDKRVRGEKNEARPWTNDKWLITFFFFLQFFLLLLACNSTNFKVLIDLSANWGRCGKFVSAGCAARKSPSLQSSCMTCWNLFPHLISMSLVTAKSSINYLVLVLDALPFKVFLMRFIESYE